MEKWNKNQINQSNKWDSLLNEGIYNRGEKLRSSFKKLDAEKNWKTEKENLERNRTMASFLNTNSLQNGVWTGTLQTQRPAAKDMKISCL